MHSTFDAKLIFAMTGDLIVPYSHDKLVKTSHVSMTSVNWFWLISSNSKTKLLAPFVFVSSPNNRRTGLLSQ